MVQWLGLWASTAEYLGSISGQGTLTPHSVPCGPPFPPENALHLRETIDFTVFANSFKQSWLVMKTRKKRIVRSRAGFPNGSAVKNPLASAGATGDKGLILGSGRPPGGGHGNPLQYSCLENPMDRGAWWGLSCTSDNGLLSELSSGGPSIDPSRDGL